MASLAQMTGMQGVFLVAAELSARGFIVSTTSRNALGADLLVTDADCQKTWSVQVKTNRKSSSFWLVGAKARSLQARSHVYVLVNLRQGDARHEFYVLSSRQLGRTMLSRKHRLNTWHFINRADVLRARDRWGVFGLAMASNDASSRRQSVDSPLRVLAARSRRVRRAR